MDVLTIDTDASSLISNVEQLMNSTTLNSEATAMVWLADGALLMFESDKDLLNNLWYQPYDLKNGTNAEIQALDRKNELAILSLSHSSFKSNEDVDQLANLIQHHAGSIVVPSDADLELNSTELSNYVSQG